MSDALVAFPGDDDSGSVLVLVGRGCRAWGADLAVYPPAGLPYRYPDASVACGEPQIRQVDGRDCLENPVLLVEVLSPSSAHFDLHAKFDQYKSIPSLREYVLFSQDRYRAIVRFKLADQIW